MAKALSGKSRPRNDRHLLQLLRTHPRIVFTESEYGVREQAERICLDE